MGKDIVPVCFLSCLCNCIYVPTYLLQRFVGNVCSVLSSGLGLNQLLSIKFASYFPMRAVPAALPAGRLFMCDVTAGVDQQMAALCVALF